MTCYPSQDPRAAIRPFFREILQEEKMAQLAMETENFSQKIMKRAIDKKAARNLMLTRTTLKLLCGLEHAPPMLTWAAPHDAWG